MTLDKGETMRKLRSLCAFMITFMLFGSGTAVAHPEPNGVPLLLTFDDGPDPVWTARVLDILNWKGMHAVFCVTGEHAQMHPELVKRIVAEGNVLCDHSWDHPHVLTLDSAHQMWQVGHTLDYLTTLVPVSSVKYWRAPYGQSRDALDGYAHSRGLEAIGWNMHGTDWSGTTDPGAILDEMAGYYVETPLHQFASSGTPAGVVVTLLHDGRGENHTTSPTPVDRWATVAAFMGLLETYWIKEPATL